jgi:glycosyltransferase involved in cell wall biosynthesis
MTDGAIASYLLVDPFPRPKWLGRFASLAVHPLASDFVLQSWRRPLVRTILDEAARVKAEGVIISDRDLLPLLAPIASKYFTVMDWCDSGLLTALRALRTVRKYGKGHTMPLLKQAWDCATQECLLSGVPDVNLFVSPADKGFMDKFNRHLQKNRVLYNGIDFDDKQSGAANKTRGRLLFSGNMEFPPNYESALWFIDRVLPLVRERVPHATFVVAGRTPPPALQARAGNGVEVTGYVPDLRATIQNAELYVAPMVSGSGFKNKVVEALACNSYIVATPMAVEFLPVELRELLLVAETPEDLAGHIIDFLSNSAAFDKKLALARDILRSQFSWGIAASTLASWVQEGKTNRELPVKSVPIM